MLLLHTQMTQINRECARYLIIGVKFPDNDFSWSRFRQMDLSGHSLPAAASKLAHLASLTSHKGTVSCPFSLVNFEAV